MKTLILVEMIILWFGNINHYMKEDDLELDTAITEIGLRTAVPTALLAFWLFLVADLGGEKIAALFGGIVVFAYLMGAANTINDITDAILKEADPKKTDAPVEDKDEKKDILGTTPAFV